MIGKNGNEEMSVRASLFLVIDGTESKLRLHVPECLFFIGEQGEDVEELLFGEVEAVGTEHIHAVMALFLFSLPGDGDREAAGFCHRDFITPRYPLIPFFEAADLFDDFIVRLLMPK